MHRLKLHIFFTILLSLSYIISINAQSTRFKRFSEEDGFPPSTVLSLHQDRTGFLWIGTTDGIYRYDGNTFKEYRYQKNNENAISNNHIRCIAEDQQQQMWFATQFGIARINIKNK